MSAELKSRRGLTGAEQQNLRSQISTALNAVDDERVQALVDSIFDLKRVNRAFCPNCRKKVEVEYPDFKGQAQALQILAAEGFGKPAETKKVEGTILLKAVHEMSDTELAQAAQHELEPSNAG